jgi:Zn-dependent M16 (insulinase) family peptidase
MFPPWKNLATAWMHNGDPVDALQMNKHINRLKEILKANPQFWQKKVKECFKVYFLLLLGYC